MNILIRADSSSTIGTGHIMRDLVLASKYKDANIIFATQNLAGNINHKIKEAGYSLEILNSNDFKELNTLIKKLDIELLIIDNYQIEYKFEKRLKKRNKDLKILSFDDTYKKHYCDILLNHNISANKKRYKNLVPKFCKIKCGQKYTLLRDEFYKAKKTDIFIAMGGVDSANINIKILKVLKKFDVVVNLVTTSANPNLQKLKKYAKKKDWIDLHINSSNIANLIRCSDLAIITPSVIANEVYFLNKKIVAIQVAKDNQNEMRKFLKKSNHITLKKFNKTKLYKKLKKEIKLRVKN